MNKSVGPEDLPLFAVWTAARPKSATTRQKYPLPGPAKLNFCLPAPRAPGRSFAPGRCYPAGGLGGAGHRPGGAGGAGGHAGPGGRGPAAPAGGGLPGGRRGRDTAEARPFAAGKPGFYANCALFTGRDYGILNY